MSGRSRSPSGRQHWGARVHGTRYAIDLLADEEPLSLAPLPATSTDVSPLRPASTTEPRDVNRDNAYLLREIRALWSRVRELEDDNRAIVMDIEWLVGFANTAQRRFRVVRRQ